MGIFPRARGVFFRGSLRFPFEMESIYAGYNKGFDKLEIVLCALNPVWLTDHPFFPAKAAILLVKKMECFIISVTLLRVHLN